MSYLSASEYEAYGLEATTPAAMVGAASSVIDTHCRRDTLEVAQYQERIRLSSGRNTARLTYLPLAMIAPATTPILSARARYMTPRRGEDLDAVEWVWAVAQVFQLPGTWTDLDPTAIDFCADTGELTLGSNLLGLSFSELEITYNAGLASIPDPIKFACAQVVRNLLATPALNVRTGNLDRMHLQYFADTLLDQTVRAALAPYVAQKVG